MTAQTYNNLHTRALQVMNEIAAFANDGNRVGGLLRDMIDSPQSGGISPLAFGAAGDGVTNDAAAVLLAITAGIAAGVPVQGNGKTYGIAGNCTLVSGAWLQDIAFKQLTPAAVGDVRTLTSGGANNLKLVRVTVNRNGNGTNGALSDDAGIYLVGGTGHYFEDVEVYGDDMGSGFAIFNATAFELVRVHVHDMKYSLGADPGDDRVQGIWINGCSNFSNLNPKVHDLGGNFGAGATLRWSRGVVYGACSEFTVTNPRAWNVDQGHDVTGGPTPNERFSITGGLIHDCYTYGFKFANTARDATVTGAVAERCGLNGFTVSGGVDLDPNTCDIEFYGCVAYDTGSNGFWGTTHGFRVQDNAANIGATRGIRFLNCKAHDRQTVPTMDYGFFNDVPANLDGRYNEAIGCRSIGHITAAFNSGMNQARVDLGLSGAKVIPNNAWTLVGWDTETDLGEMYDVGALGQIFARRAGDFQVAAGISFAANATGQRGIRLSGVGGVPILGTTVLVNAAAAGEVSLNLSWLKKMVAGNDLRIEVFQNSGGNLNIQTTSGAVVEQVA
jgi:hypothetical protein